MNKTIKNIKTEEEINFEGFKFGVHKMEKI